MRGQAPLRGDLVREPQHHSSSASTGDRFRAFYDRVVIDELRAAVEALNDGDIEPFIALIDENSEWRSITRGHLWWKHTPT